MINNFIKIKKKLAEIVDRDFTKESKKYGENRLNDVEREFTITLPNEYRSFLSNYGNFIVNEDYYYRAMEPSPWSPQDGFESVDFFYGLDNDKKDLKYNIRQYRDQINENVIPIASSPGDNQICIGVKGDYEGKIYFWDHESEGGKDLYLIAPSFYAFIMSFQKHKRKIDIDLNDVELKLDDDLLKED